MAKRRVASHVSLKPIAAEIGVAQERLRALLRTAPRNQVAEIRRAIRLLAANKRLLIRICRSFNVPR